MRLKAKKRRKISNKGIHNNGKFTFYFINVIKFYVSFLYLFNCKIGIQYKCNNLSKKVFVG